MIVFSDSHVHLADPAFADEADAVIQRARAVGARALVCIGESAATALRARRLAERHAGFVFFTAGVHPHDAAGWDDATDAPAVRDAVAHGAVAVGECGLDTHYDHAPRAQQRYALDAQLALAEELHKPIVLHTREAEADTAEFLKRAGVARVRGVLHCYTGSAALAEAALSVGWFVSFSGIITFKSWTDDALLRLVPSDRLLVESDAPYLAPVPHRGKRNESAFVPLTLARLATVRQQDVDALGWQTLRNTKELFDLPDAVVAAEPTATSLAHP
ncbi:TatD family hydrolase [Gemmatimonas sp.]|uniref:TatD family hydrolase n=1 Tax=Gemmatimonas sp. TaxID=1962908 RepID=UPI00286C4D71|nr:TatD family hydrolase [Gemmatimonas sp.]